MKKISVLRLAVLVSVALCLVSCSPKETSEKVYERVLEKHWNIRSQDKVDLTGEALSTVGAELSTWHSITLPSTVFAGLRQTGLYEDVFVGDNLNNVKITQFEQAWWYQSEFEVLDDPDNQYYDLIFEGLNYRANIWLNGVLVADSSEVEGPFGIWEFNVSSYIKQGKNAIAIQVFPPKYNDLTIGFVDWNPAAPDNNMGIWRPVKLISHGAVSADETFVRSKVNKNTLDDANLQFSTSLTNLSQESKKVKVVYHFNNSIIEKTVAIDPESIQMLKLSADEFDQLHIKSPKLWWPNLMGKANLYNLKTEVYVDGVISHARDTRFGIREIEDYFNEEGHRGYKVNGKRVLIKGAGWVDDIFLSDSDEKVAAQVAYAKHMNMNCIRLEGFWGRNKTLYEKADELGMLIMVGWSCQWEWEGYCGRPNDDFMAIRSEKDQEVQARAFQDQVKWLRNHPSVFLWVYGSDKLPLPALEAKLDKYVNEVDDSRPTLASCKYADFEANKDWSYVNHSKVSGATGVKMLGPYAYTSPNYWYLDKKAGGAYGFNTETGPGAQVPPLESLKKMIPEKSLWPMDEMWDFHSGRNDFSSLKRDLEAFNARYGKANNVDEFAFNMQISNYEAIRAMFEAFEVNKNNTTGIIQWMLNSAWPELFWQLYDWYLQPNGAFYGTQKANQPLNAIYNYKDEGVYLTNSYLRKFEDLSMNIKVFDLDSKLIFEKEANVSIDEDESKLIQVLPEMDLNKVVYFVDLRINDNIGNLLASNFYWLSTKKDEIDFENALWFYTPFKSYADFTSLHKMAESKVSYSFKQLSTKDGRTEFVCDIENESDKIAFFIELALIDTDTKGTFVPVFWEDNYISLLPGEKRQIKVSIDSSIIEGKETELRVKGFNTTNK